MSRAIHNALLIEDSDSSDFEDDIAMFNVCIRKCQSFQPGIDYFNLLDKDEFVKRFRLTKSTVVKVLNEIADQLKHLTNR